MHSVQPTGLLARHFLADYRRSLSDYRFFYDDLAEMGNPDQAKHVFYYVPGISGSPGQMRISLPSLVRVFGPRVYLKGLDVPEFSASRPIWEKYTIPNTNRKLEQIREDLAALLRRFHRFAVICSSNGLYDFLAAAATFQPGELESRVELAWVSVAPDRFSPTPWQRLLFPLNGLVFQEHEWFAYPNHRAFRFINPEVPGSFAWREGHQERRFHKKDLESRFRCFGLEWDYISPSQFSDIAQYVVAQIGRQWNAPAEALVAANDGYWQGASLEAVESVVRRYVPQAHCEFRPGSHVGVVNPTNLTDVFTRVLARLRALMSGPRGSSEPHGDVSRSGPLESAPVP
jgi:hypothetical protein